LQIRCKRRVILKIIALRLKKLVQQFSNTCDTRVSPTWYRYGHGGTDLLHNGTTMHPPLTSHEQAPMGWLS
jgi:hypothetical protein